MAVPNNYIDKIKKDGDSRMISPAADMVRVDNDNFEGTDLDEVLDEVAQAIEDAGEGGYAPPAGGIPKTDLSQDVQTSLGKADTALQSYTETDPTVPSWAKQPSKPTYTAQEVGALPANTTIPTKTSDLSNDSGFVTETEMESAINDALDGQGGEVSVTTNEDGTFVIHVGDTDYTINLNHTHEGMAKLVVCEESDLPSTLEEDTIYGVEEDGEISVLYVGGIPFYGGGGGGTSTPVLRQPTDGSTIDVGKIESGQSIVSKTITVKGKNLTQDLTVAVTGTGYSVNKQTISAADANVGTTLTIICTSTADEAAGTLSIASSEVSCDCDLVANLPTYEDLRGVKLTGDQWLQTDYYPNANTEFRLSCRFEQRSDTQSLSKQSADGAILDCKNGQSNKDFRLFNIGPTSSNLYNPWNIGFTNESSVMYNGEYQIISLGNDGNTRPYIFVDPVQIYYTKGSSNGTFGFTDGTHTLTVPTSLKTSTQENAMMIGQYDNGNGTTANFSMWNLTVYSLVITENGNEVRHWVPKMKNGVTPGLYDTVTGKFISSETSTELVEIY